MEGRGTPHFVFGVKPPIDKPIKSELHPTPEAIKAAQRITTLVDFLHQEEGYDRKSSRTRQDIVKGRCIDFSRYLVELATGMNIQATTIREEDAFPFANGKPNAHTLVLIKLTNGNYLSVDPTVAQIKDRKDSNQVGDPNTIAEFFEGTPEQIQRYLQDRYGGAWNSVTERNNNGYLIDSDMQFELKNAQSRNVRGVGTEKQRRATTFMNKHQQTDIPNIQRSEKSPLSQEELMRKEAENYFRFLFSSKDIGHDMKRIVHHTFLDNLTGPTFDFVDDSIWPTEGGREEKNRLFIDYLKVDNINNLGAIKDIFLLQLRDFLITTDITESQYIRLLPVITELLSEGHLQISYDEYLNRVFLLPQ